MQAFKASEVVQFAVQIEVNGEKFYRSMIPKLKDKKVVDMFEFFAKQEIVHKQRFTALLNKIESFEPAESYPGEYFAYLEAYVTNAVFTKPDSADQYIAKTGNEKDAVDLAIGFEKDSILYFVELKRFVPDNEQVVIDKIIDEERSHYLKLSELKKNLK
jgi:rubrerythrin